MNNETKSTLNLIIDHIYSNWGVDPAYFFGSYDCTERALAHRDAELIEYINRLMGITSD